MSTRTRTQINTGSTIENGATVLLAAAGREDWCTILAVAPHGEFVTWIGRNDGTATCWGHYFGQDLAAALADYYKRQGK